MLFRSPSGKLTVSANGDIALSDAARIDMAGRTVSLLDAVRYSWGGDVALESAHGNITQAAGSVIDVSAVNNRAGSLSATALDAAAGHVVLGGSLRGSASGHYDAGGTMVPFLAGSIDVRAQTIDDFAGLNQRLTLAGVTGARNFQLKQGDLAIGDELVASSISVSVDGGRLTVNGRIDASGERVGTIRLAARDGLTLGSGSVLDAHGTVLRVDSYGQPIDAPNRAVVELTTTQGRLALSPGARIDVRSAVSVVWGQIAAGSAPNAIDNTGYLAGTMRCLDADVWEEAGALLDEVVRQVAAPYGVHVQLEHVRGVPPVHNTEGETALIETAARRELGSRAIVLTPQSMGGEDFAWMTQKVPGSMLRLGTRSPGGPIYDLHRGDYAPDERAIGVGIKLFGAVVEQFIGENAETD